MTPTRSVSCVCKCTFCTVMALPDPTALAATLGAQALPLFALLLALLLLGVAAGMVLPTPLLAQGDGKRPIKVLVGLPPGGATDAIARVVVERPFDAQAPARRQFVQRLHQALRIVFAHVEAGLPVGRIAQQQGVVGALAGLVEPALECRELLERSILVVRIHQQQELPGHCLQRVLVVDAAVGMEGVVEVVVGVVFVGGHRAPPALARHGQARSIRPPRVQGACP